MEMYNERKRDNWNVRLDGKEYLEQRKMDMLYMPLLKQEIANIPFSFSANPFFLISIDFLPQIFELEPICSF